MSDTFIQAVSNTNALLLPADILYPSGESDYDKNRKNYNKADPKGKIKLGGNLWSLLQIAKYFADSSFAPKLNDNNFFTFEIDLPEYIKNFQSEQRNQIFTQIKEQTGIFSNELQAVINQYKTLIVQQTTSLNKVVISGNNAVSGSNENNGAATEIKLLEDKINKAISTNNIADKFMQTSSSMQIRSWQRIFKILNYGDTLPLKNKAYDNDVFNIAGVTTDPSSAGGSYIKKRTQKYKHVSSHRRKHVASHRRKHVAPRRK